MSFSSDPNKRPRVSQVTGPVQPLGTVNGRTENPLLKGVEERAIKAIQERRKNLVLFFHSHHRLGVEKCGGGKFLDSIVT